MSWDECDDDDIKERVEGESVNNVQDVNINKIIAVTLGNIRKVQVKVELSESSLEDEWTILLDTCAEESAFRNRNLFKYITDTDDPIQIVGVSGDVDDRNMYISHGGNTEFGYAYYSKDVIGNILSFGNCVDTMHMVRYDRDQDAFYIQSTKESDIFKFRRIKNEANLYKCKLNDADSVVRSMGTLVAIQTVHGNMNKYSKREVQRAQIAKDYLRKLGGITPGTLVKLLGNNRIANPEINSQDVARCLDIYGKDILQNLKGKTTRNKATTYEREYDIVSKSLVKEEQILYIDIMFVNKIPYLVTKTSSPLSYRVVRKLKGRNAKEIFSKLARILNHLKNIRVKIVAIRCDEEAAIESEELERKLCVYDESIDLDISPGGEAVGVIEREIRTEKERVRGILTTLPYETDETLEEWLIKYVIYFLNWMPNSGAVDGKSAFEKLLQRPIYANTELKYGFGDYVQLGDGETSNDMTERTRGALALMPTGNRDGSWYFLILKTWEVVRRSNLNVMPIPDEVIEYINQKARLNRAKRGIIGEVMKMGLWRSNNINDYNDEEENNAENEENDNDDENVNQYMPNYNVAIGDDNFEFIENDDINNAVDDDIVDDDVDERALINDIFGEDSDNNDERDDNEVPEVIQEEYPIYEQQQQGNNDEINIEEINNERDQPYNLRHGRAQLGRWKGIASTLKKNNRKRSNKDNKNKRHIYQMTINQAIKKLGYEAVLSVVKEIMQLNDKETFEGINTNDLTEEEYKRIITSSTFLKDKYTADGIFDKLKARLVAGGHLQDRNIYDNGGSPTASTTSVFMVAGIAAEERRAVAHVDFPGAFLNAKMPSDDGKAVYMRLNKFESMVLVKIDPTYHKFIDKTGRITVRLKRALYGCVESARLWYEKVSKDLMDMGYVKNNQDMCVFNRIERDKSQSTIVLHVDDFLMTAKNEDILSEIIKEIEKKYEQLSVHRGRVIEYIGMKFDFTNEGKVKITMQGYIQDLLEFCKNIEGSVSTPALDNLFKVGEKNKVLKESDKEYFHSVTAKLLYLGKRVRPDILTAVSFLTKRVQSPTDEDMRKLERVIRYIRGTRDMGIIIEARVNLGVFAYVDASYGVHTDYKSHTGCVIGIGKGPVYAKSSTQKINSKSSSEAELIGLSDSINQIVWVRNFLISQGYNIEEATVYEDNMSTINMVKNGKSNSERTRHIAIRFYFVADRVQSKEIKIQYMQTSNMLADILTKPLQGKLFIRLRNQLLNWN